MDKKAVVKELVAVAGLLTAEPKELFVILVDYIWMDVAEDTYEQGEIGRRTMTCATRAARTTVWSMPSASSGPARNCISSESNRGPVPPCA